MHFLLRSFAQVLMLGIGRTLTVSEAQCDAYVARFWTPKCRVCSRERPRIEVQHFYNHQKLPTTPNTGTILSTPMLTPSPLSTKHTAETLVAVS